METAFQLYITLDQDFYRPKSLITGTLHIRTLESFNLESIDLTLSKNYESSISVKDQITHSEKIRVYKQKFSLFQSDILKIASGHHKYPFSFYIRHNDNATTDARFVNGGEKIKITNKYVLCGEVKIYGAYMPVATTHKELVIVDTNRTTDTVNMDVEISSCFCIFKEFFKVQSKLSNQEFYYGDKAYITINSGGVMKSVDIYFYQVFSLDIENSIKTKCKIISENHYELNESAGKFDIDILDVPSTVSEELFDIKYIVQVVVRFGGNVKIQYKHDIFIVKKPKKEEVVMFLDVMKGVEAVLKYFVIE